MIKKYHYRLEGLAAQSQSWCVEGEVESEWCDVFETILSHAFHQLTRGKAIYGKPGIGCRGPYNMTKLTLDQLPAMAEARMQ
jgi:hypothetical protein